ncbi:protein dead ringer homolog [Clytia hemisphaerica]|uniref:ARID domain-containing protein n=1 Tax=Clytia hemisphaerica TaxID=252671 RepID=A0A7M5V8Q6_9CNID
MAGESEEKLNQKDEEQKIELTTMTIKNEVIDDVSPTGYPRPESASPSGYPRHSSTSYRRYPSENQTAESRSSLEDWDDEPESPSRFPASKVTLINEEPEQRGQHYYESYQTRQSPDPRRRIDQELNLDADSQSPKSPGFYSNETRRSNPDLSKYDRQSSSQRSSGSPHESIEHSTIKRQFSRPDESLKRNTIVEPPPVREHRFEGAYKTTGGDAAEKVWLYEENIKKLYNLDKNPQRQIFLDEFFSYRRTHGLYCKIPVIARKPLDVFLLYSIVQKYGGFEQTMKNRMWSQIARELELPRTMTSGAFTLKLKYIRLLYQFECYKVKKQVNKSILFNEASILPEQMSQMNDHVPQHLSIHQQQNPAYRQHQQTSKSSSNDHRRGNDDYYRERRDEHSRENMMRVKQRDDQFNERPTFSKTDRNRYSPHRDTGGSSPSSNNDIVLRSSTPPSSDRNHRDHHRRLPPSIHSRKRGVHEELDDDTDTGTSGSQPKSPRLDTQSVSRFSVDVVESSRDSIVLKVRMNNDVFEGVLECTQRGDIRDYAAEQKM